MCTGDGVIVLKRVLKTFRLQVLAILSRPSVVTAWNCRGLHSETRHHLAWLDSVGWHQRMAAPKLYSYYSDALGATFTPHQ